MTSARSILTRRIVVLGDPDLSTIPGRRALLFAVMDFRDPRAALALLAHNGDPDALALLAPDEPRVVYDEVAPW